MCRSTGLETPRDRGTGQPAGKVGRPSAQSVVHHPPSPQARSDAIQRSALRFSHSRSVREADSVPVRSRSQLLPLEPLRPTRLRPSPPLGTRTALSPSWTPLSSFTRMSHLPGTPASGDGRSMTKGRGSRTSRRRTSLTSPPNTRSTPSSAIPSLPRTSRDGAAVRVIDGVWNDLERWKEKGGGDRGRGRGRGRFARHLRGFSLTESGLSGLGGIGRSWTGPSRRVIGGRFRSRTEVSKVT